MLRRRQFLSAIAVGPVAASLAPAGLARAEDDIHRAPSDTGAGTSPARPSPERAGARDEQMELPPPAEISQGLQLAGGFVVVQAYGVHFGAMPFVLEGEGRRFQLDVLRRDPSGPSGLFDTADLSIFVHDHGALLTEATYERGARALGAALQRRIAAGVACPRLSSFGERRAAHPTERFAVDVDRAAPPAAEPSAPAPMNASRPTGP